MKKPFNKSNRGNCTVVISAVLQEPGYLQNLVEKLARRDHDNYNLELLGGEWQSILTSSLEGYALGDLVLSDEKDFINSLFDTCFLFTCTREKENHYKMAWVCSLS
ncbi:MAG: hypothetical protein JST17_00540 [Bacteroidetes bacterium]|nr:hypothetical protein [Bacteroidota bacterium]MBS1931772.1 hypothetical protein [Bacteroidota bacterium]